MIVCSITVEQDCSACICERVPKTVVNSNADLDLELKIERGRLFVQEKNIWKTKNMRRDGQAMYIKNLAKPKEIVMKESLETRFHQQQFGAS